MSNTCKKCPFIAMISANKLPQASEVVSMRFGRLEIDVVKIKGKKTNYFIPVYCYEDVEKVLKAENTLTGHS